MKIKLLLALTMLIFTRMNIQAQEKNILENLLKSREDLFAKLLENPQQYEIQILYTQINRDAKNRPSFETFAYQVDKDKYFYPASTIKLPVALLALEKLNKLKIKGLDKNTPLRIEAARKPQTEVSQDSTAKNGLPSIAHYIKKLFVVSDNDAYNRLYEFLGQGYINWVLEKKEYETQILGRLATSDFDEEANRYTNPMKFYKGNKTIYEQPELFNKVKYISKIKNPLKGKGYINKKGDLVKEPFDFTGKSYITLQSVHEILKALIFPMSVKPNKRFNLTASDYEFIYKSMSMLPKESKYPLYDKEEHQDGFTKYFYSVENKEKMPENIRIFNKVGLAYGYSLENAYVVDFEAKTEFLISAVIYTNKNQILNDGKYEYDDIAFPFFQNLGKVLLWHEKNRVRKYPPNLDAFKFKYEDE